MGPEDSSLAADKLAWWEGYRKVWNPCQILRVSILGWIWQSGDSLQVWIYRLRIFGSLAILENRTWNFWLWSLCLVLLFAHNLLLWVTVQSAFPSWCSVLAQAPRDGARSFFTWLKTNFPVLLLFFPIYILLLAMWLLEFPVFSWACSKLDSHWSGFAKWLMLQIHYQGLERSPGEEKFS